MILIIVNKFVRLNTDLSCYWIIILWLLLLLARDYKIWTLFNYYFIGGLSLILILFNAFKIFIFIIKLIAVNFVHECKRFEFSNAFLSLRETVTTVIAIGVIKNLCVYFRTRSSTTSTAVLVTYLTIQMSISLFIIYYLSAITISHSFFYIIINYISFI